MENNLINIHDLKQIQDLQNMLDDQVSQPELILKAISNINYDLIEYYWILIQQANLSVTTWHIIKAELNYLADKIRKKHIHTLPMLISQQIIWMRCAILKPICNINPINLYYIISKILIEVGLCPAMSREKIPKPSICIGYPLPLGINGHNEWIEVVLRNPLTFPLSDLHTCINKYAPIGLTIKQCVHIPYNTMSITKMCHQAQWRWLCPHKLLITAKNKLDNFMKSDRFDIEKNAKLNGQKCVKSINIRPFISSYQWIDNYLYIQTPITAGKVINLCKILSIILELTLPIANLERIAIDLKTNWQNISTDKTETKLHNMYEDAVVLTI